MSRALHGFPGGLRLAGDKRRSTSTPVRAAPLGARYVVALAQSSGAPAIACVAPGDRVRRGDPIARPDPDGRASAALHAPTSGTVVAIEARPVAHPSGLDAPCIVIDADGTDAAAAPLDPLPADATREALAGRLRECGVVGLGGAAFPTDLKLGAIELLILNGAECEPHIACDDMLMRTRADAVVEGALLLRQACGATRAAIAVEADKPEALAALRTALDAAPGRERLELVAVPARYPEGGERQLIQTLTGREVPRGGLPRDLGILCVNVGTAAAAADAALRGLPLTSRYVTVSGDGVRAPCNLEARIGTPIADLVAAAGGYAEGAARLVMGGPMMGFALPDDAIAIVKATNCVLVLGAGELAAAREPSPCIRCGECVEVCPASLLPQQLHWHVRAGELDAARRLALDACIECGCCDLVCPSHIPLAAWFRHAKAELRAKDLERAGADLARARFEARRARQEREERERAERLAAKQAALTKPGGGA